MEEDISHLHHIFTTSLESWFDSTNPDDMGKRDNVWNYFNYLVGIIENQQQMLNDHKIETDLIMASQSTQLDDALDDL